eukprot:gnl/Trimastix_PCT/2518.p2 GENE.gnl/Trimastix_PCT/2518~~gnl/Trimastix_PCT/2518.p2  ORF type:complete len:277 (+),score=91.97 gnl/Trimastix_PCT/2518:52-882(+)
MVTPIPHANLKPTFRLPEKALIGMVHVHALPGTAFSSEPMTQVIEAAVTEATMLEQAGFGAIILENMHDIPYLNREVGPEIVAAMTAVACAVRKAVSVPIGIQVLAGANKAALSVALCSGAQFIRAEGFIFAHVADEGTMNSDAGELLRYRRKIGAGHIAVFCDVKKKHSAHSITADVDIAETARAALFFGSDGLIVTGTSTGAPTATSDVEQVHGAVPLPVLVGSGVTPANLGNLFPHADAFIVGSFIKEEGDWARPLDPARLRELVAAHAALLK